MKMNIPRESLNFLMDLLPKMSFAQTVLASQRSGIELVSLLNIRTAGSIQRSIFAATKVDENVIDMDDTHLEPKEDTGVDLSIGAIASFNAFLKEQTLKKNGFLEAAKKRLEGTLPADADKNAIFKKLEDKKVATPGKNLDIANKAVDDFLEANDLNKEAVGAYVSLFRLSKGYLDDNIGSSLTNAANNLTGGGIDLMYPSKEDKLTEIVTSLILGPISKKDVELDEKSGTKKRQKSKGLMAYLESKKSTISAKLILVAIAKRAINAIQISQRKVNKKDTKHFWTWLKKSTNESAKKIFKLLKPSLTDEEGKNLKSNKNSWKVLLDSKNQPRDADIEDYFEESWKAFNKETSSNVKTESYDRTIKQDEGEVPVIDTIEKQDQALAEDAIKKEEVLVNLEKSKKRWKLKYRTRLEKKIQEMLLSLL